MQRLTTELASLRDDMHVLTAIVQRLDNSQGRMLEELRAMHRNIPARPNACASSRNNADPGR